MAAIDDSVLASRDLATLDKTTHRLPVLTETALVSAQGLLTTTAGNAAYATAASVTTATTNASTALSAATTATSNVSTLTSTVTTLTSTVSAKADASAVPATAKAAAVALGVLPVIRYTTSWPTRSTWIATNYPGYTGAVQWDSALASGAAAPSTAAVNDRWTRRRDVA